MESEIVSFETSAIGSYLKPGDIIDVMDNKRTVGRFAGKIIDVWAEPDAKSVKISVDYPINSLIDDNDKNTWKSINIYTLSGNQTIDALNNDSSMTLESFTIKGEIKKILNTVDIGAGN